MARSRRGRITRRCRLRSGRASRRVRAARGLVCARAFLLDGLPRRSGARGVRRGRPLPPAERRMERSDRGAFGRPIGGFQAVQHKRADMLVHTETSRSAAYYAAYALANGLPDASFAASVAMAYCLDAAHSVTGECIQLHGGIGFTWEH